MATTVPVAGPHQAAKTPERGTRSRFVPSFTGMYQVNRRVARSSTFIRLLVIMVVTLCLVFTVLVICVLSGLNGLLPHIQEHERVKADPLSAVTVLPAQLLDEAQFAAALAACPQRTAALYCARARALVQEGQYQRAVADFTRAGTQGSGDLAPTDALAMAETMLKLSHPDDALRYLLTRNLATFSADERARAISLIGSSQLAVAARQRRQGGGGGPNGLSGLGEMGTTVR